MNRTYTTLLAIIVCSLAYFSASAQGVYFDPAPTDVTQPVRLYIDITSSECNCPELQDADSVSNPLYIWAWNPNEARQPVDGAAVTNGMWNDSNENLKLTQDDSNPSLWYFDFLGVSLVEFYDVPPAVFYNTGIDFLIKQKSGEAGDSGAEQKSPDINIIPEPIGCFDIVCPFPTTWFQDEFFVITYDNNKETNNSLQNLGPDEAIIVYRYSINNGPLLTLQGDDDRFKLDYDGDGFFSTAMLPEEFFELNPGENITEIRILITKPPFNAPPFSGPTSLFPGCAE